MKFSRERFQNGSLRRVTRRIGLDVWEFRFRDHLVPNIPMRQITLGTLEYQTETAARRALQALLLKSMARDLCCAMVSNLARTPTFGVGLDKFTANERLKEVKAFRPGEVVDEGLKFTTTGYLSVIKQHLRPAWGKVQLVDIKALESAVVVETAKPFSQTKQNIKAVFTE